MQNITLHLSGLHCTSCAINIDMTLEDLPGVKSSDTNYAKSELIVTYNPNLIDITRIKKEITSLGYKSAT